MNADELKTKIKELEDLKKEGIITEDQFKGYKDRLVAEFGRTGIPAKEKAVPIMETTDMAHLPGRLVGGLFQGLGNMSKDTANRIAEIEREEREQKKGKPRGPPSLDDLPPQYR